jgi:hypothetical protein
LFTNVKAKLTCTLKLWLVLYTLMCALSISPVDQALS